MMIETPATTDRRVLFLVASARQNGNTEALARRAAAALPPGTTQEWVRLADLALPPFADIRHDGDGTYPAPIGDAARLFAATLAATDLVFVAPVYWYGLPTPAQLYLDHWSGWMRVPGAAFKARMAAKALWGVSVTSDEDRSVADPLFRALELTARYMGMRWGGRLLGYGNRPGDVAADTGALAAADRFFAGEPAAAAA